jgi:anti-sigma B factor antagonist
MNSPRSSPGTEMVPSQDRDLATRSAPLVARGLEMANSLGTGIERPHASEIGKPGWGRRVFHIRTERVNQETRLVTQGDPEESYTLPELEQHMIALIGSGMKHVIVDLAGASVFDDFGTESPILGFLVRVMRQSGPADGSISFVAGDEAFSKIFELAGLDQVFAIYTSRDEAVAAVESSPQPAQRKAGQLAEREASRDGTFRISEQAIDDTTHIFELSGDIDLYVTPEFKERLVEVVESGKTQIVVDVSRTFTIDAANPFGLLAGLAKRLRSSSGSLALVCTDEDEKGYRLAFDQLVPVYLSQDEALAAIGVRLR